MQATSVLSLVIVAMMQLCSTFGFKSPLLFSFAFKSLYSKSTSSCNSHHHHAGGAFNTFNTFKAFTQNFHTVRHNLSHIQSTCSPRDEEDLSTSRREFSSTMLKFIGTTAVFTMKTLQAQAACLPGDESVDCIGVYKVPIDDAIRNMIDTPEHLAKFAPDLRWTPPIQYPTNYQLAKEEIFQFKSNLTDELIPLVSKGDLTSAGVLILKIVPRITVAGRFIVSTLNKTQSFSMKAFRVESAQNELLANLGAVDILIGQSLTGQIGSITAAQIQILQELNDAKQRYEELIKAIPEGFDG